MPAVCHLRHDGGFYLAGEADGLAHPHPTDDWEYYLISIHRNGIRADGSRPVAGTERVMDAFLLESRITRFLVTVFDAAQID